MLCYKVCQNECQRLLIYRWAASRKNMTPIEISQLRLRLFRKTGDGNVELYFYVLLLVEPELPEFLRALPITRCRG